MHKRVEDVCAQRRRVGVAVVPGVPVHRRTKPHSTKLTLFAPASWSRREEAVLSSDHRLSFSFSLEGNRDTRTRESTHTLNRQIESNEVYLYTLTITWRTRASETPMKIEVTGAPLLFTPSSSAYARVDGPRSTALTWHTPPHELRAEFCRSGVTAQRRALRSRPKIHRVFSLTQARWNGVPSSGSFWRAPEGCVMLSDVSYVSFRPTYANQMVS